MALLLEGRANAQCQTSYTFAVCPEFDTVYVENCIRDPLALAAFRLSTGELKWRAPVPKGTQFQCDLAATADVVASSAAPENEEVGDYSRELVQAWDARTGRLAWVNSSGRTYGLVSAGPYIFASTKSPDGMIVIDGPTGKIGWKPPSAGRGALGLYDPKDRILLTDRYAADAYSGQILKYWPSEWEVSSAAFAGNSVVIGTSSTGGGPTKLVAYSLPGYEVAWMREDARKRDFAALAADADHVVVAIYPDRDSYRLPGNMEVQALANSSGKLLWSKTIGSAFLGESSSSPVGLVSGLAIVSTLDKGRLSSTLQAFDVGTGRRKWTLDLKSSYAGVTCADEYCYLAGVAGKVVAVDVRTGAQRWYRIPTQ
jgi:outer membrane protein assembly factor BamB